MNGYIYQLTLSIDLSTKQRLRFSLKSILWPGCSRADLPESGDEAPRCYISTDQIIMHQRETTTVSIKLVSSLCVTHKNVYIHLIVLCTMEGG